MFSKTSWVNWEIIGREGLLTCLLHFSLRVKGIMVSVVSQLLCQDQNLSDPHHLAAIFYLRGLLNTSISRSTQTILHLRILGGLSNYLHLSYYPQQYSIPRVFPEGCSRGVMVKAMNCGIVVREFVLQSRYYVHFRANTLGKGMNPLILPPAMGK